MATAYIEWDRAERQRVFWLEGEGGFLPPPDWEEEGFLPPALELHPSPPYVEMHLLLLLFFVFSRASRLLLAFLVPLVSRRRSPSVDGGRVSGDLLVSWWSRDGAWMNGSCDFRQGRESYERVDLILVYSISFSLG